METVADQDRYLIVEDLIRQLPEIADRVAMSALMERYHIADIMEAMRELPEEVQARLLQFLEPEEAVELLEEATDEEAAEYVGDMPPAKVAQIVEAMAPDEAADLLDSLSKSKAETILSLLPREDATAVRELLSYEPDTAGGIMTNEFFHVTPEMTVLEVLEAIKSGEHEEENLDMIVVCRPDMKFVGLLAAEDMLQASFDTKISELMERAAVTVGPSADQEVCARYITKYEVPILPVLDNRRRIIGIITIDDIIEVLDEEASEDMYRMAGVGVERPLEDGALIRACKRLPWFAVTILGTSVLAWIISKFGATINQVVALSFFIPAIMGLGGNVGVQASTITVRGIAKGEIQFSDIFWLLRRELMVGLIIGVVCALSLSLVAYFMTAHGYEGNRVLVAGSATEQMVYTLDGVEVAAPFLGVLPRFPVTVGVAMFVGIMGSVLLGTCVPMLCHRAGVDPALASGPFVTTMIDICTQTLYLSLATFILLV